MEPLKHECGVAMIRLLKPLEYYQEKYGTWMFGLNKLYLMMEKQHNRGQEGAGMSCVKLDGQPGLEYMFRERAEGKDAITEIFGRVQKEYASLSPANCIWDTCDIPRRERRDCHTSIHSCAATTGRPRTSASAATST